MPFAFEAPRLRAEAVAHADADGGGDFFFLLTGILRTRLRKPEFETTLCARPSSCVRTFCAPWCCVVSFVSLVYVLRVMSVYATS